MLLKIADNTVIETNNLISMLIEKKKFPNTPDKPNPHWENDKQIWDYGFVVEFAMIGEIIFHSHIYNTKTEAETKLREFMGAVDANKN
jgi:hypothetical protein